MKIFYDEKKYGEDYDAVNKLCKIQKGDIFIDVGSNIGQEIEYFARLGLHLDSYEPHPELFKYLKLKYSGYSNITLNNIAVYNDNCFKTLYFKKSPPELLDPQFDDKKWALTDGGSTLIKEKANVGGRYGASVRCVDIVDVINKVCNSLKNTDRKTKNYPIKILKIDVEGAEYHILRRMIETNTVFIPKFIFFEDHSRKVRSDEFNYNKKFVYEFIRKNKFKFYKW